jgi:hypothetical protein
MNEFLIKLIGIVMLVSTPMGDAPNGKHVVIPAWTTDGAHAGQTIHAHVPYLAVTLETCGKELDCVDRAELARWGTVTEFVDGDKWAFVRLNGVYLKFNSKAPALTIDSSYSQRIPKILNYCPDFQLDPSFRDDVTRNPRKAATFDIDHGTLSARGDIFKDQAAETWWRVETPGDLIITATRFGASEPTNILRLKAGTKVRIGNQLESQILDPLASSTMSHHHFLVFQSLNRATAASDCVTSPGPHTPTAGRDPLADCSNTDFP